MNVLIITPTERENSNMLSALKRAKSTHNTYTVIRSGIGKASAAANTTAAVIKADRPFDMIAVVGFAAGTIGFRQGDIVMPSTARYHDCDIPDGFIPELTDTMHLCGKDDITIFTGDSFVNANSIKEIKKRFNTEQAIFDMEITAIVIAMNEIGNIPVIAIKMISDVPEDGHTEHSYDAFADSHSDFSEILSKLESL